MLVFEIFDTMCNRHVLIIGEIYRAYEQADGSVILNDEGSGFTFVPIGTYKEFRQKFSSVILEAK